MKVGYGMLSMSCQTTYIRAPRSAGGYFKHIRWPRRHFTTGLCPAIQACVYARWMGHNCVRVMVSGCH